MTRLQLSILGATVAAGLIISLVVRLRVQVSLHGRDDALQQLRYRLSELWTEQQRLVKLVAATDKATSNDFSTEIRKLRDEIETLRKLAEEERAAAVPVPEAPRAAAKTEVHPPEYWQRLHERAGGKSKDAVILSGAFLMHARDQGRCASTVEEMAPYVDRQWRLTGTNEFEIIYHGTLESLKRVPTGLVAVLRDRQAWLAPSGKWARIYGMANGVAQVVESDDNFQAWEAAHVIPPPTASR